MNQSPPSKSTEKDPGDDAIGALLPDSVRPELDSYGCMLLPPRLHEASAVRRQFLALSLQIHPDRNGGSADRVADATTAFQKLSTAFEILYDRESQKRHLEALRLRRGQREEEEEGNESHDGCGKTTAGHDNDNHTGKRQRGSGDWKARAKEKRKRKKAEAAVGRGGGFWSKRHSWSAVVEEMRRRERLERDFVKAKSDERLEKRVRGMAWRAMRICRTLDERAGCPPSFVNGLFAPLYEQDVLREHRGQLPGGWEIRDEDPALAAAESSEPLKRIYRHVPTGKERDDHPSPEVERLLEKARAAERTNQFRFHSEPRLFLGEIIEYLRNDHNYHDMDDDVAELEEEERARNGRELQQQEYDF